MHWKKSLPVVPLERYLCGLPSAALMTRAEIRLSATDYAYRETAGPRPCLCIVPALGGAATDLQMNIRVTLNTLYNTLGHISIPSAVVSSWPLNIYLVQTARALVLPAINPASPAARPGSMDLEHSVQRRFHTATSLARDPGTTACVSPCISPFSTHLSLYGITGALFSSDRQEYNHVTCSSD